VLDVLEGDLGPDEAEAGGSMGKPARSPRTYNKSKKKTRHSTQVPKHTWRAQRVKALPLRRKSSTRFARRLAPAMKIYRWS